MPLLASRLHIKIHALEGVTNFRYFELGQKRVRFCEKPHKMSDIKMLFDFGWHAWRQPKASAIYLALVLTVATGCGKSNAPTSAAPSSNATTVSPAPSPQAVTSVPPVAATNSVVPKEEMQAMNRALMNWMRANNRRPKTFQEFATSTDFQIPAAPPGKQYAFNARGFIVLVDAN
jgi:hypothetical protein